jgi:hypothetical protein
MSLKYESMFKDRNNQEASGQINPGIIEQDLDDLSSSLLKIQRDTYKELGGVIQAAKDARIVCEHTQALAERYISEGNNDVAKAILTLRRTIVSKILE